MKELSLEHFRIITFVTVNATLVCTYQSLPETKIVKNGALAWTMDTWKNASFDLKDGPLKKDA